MVYRDILIEVRDIKHKHLWDCFSHGENVPFLPGEIITLGQCGYDPVLKVKVISREFIKNKTNDWGGSSKREWATTCILWCELLDAWAAWEPEKV